MRLRHWFLATIAASVLGTAAMAATDEEDHRAWQHGIDLVRLDGKLMLVWSSPGNPPRARPGGDWQHDIYYAWLDAPVVSGEVPLQPQVLVSAPEAQEPPSVAINSRGTMLITAEDGNGGINQHAGIWNSALGVVRPYPLTIRRGGHSGHAAALGERFLVTYGEGWVDGGGWQNRGTGETIYARIVGNGGELRREVKLTSPTLADPRDSWPLVAASDRNWLVIWQRYPELTLQGALVDANGRLAKRLQVASGLQLRYAYDVAFAPRLGLYVVTGSAGDGGFVALIDRAGKVLRVERGLPPMAAESRMVIGEEGADVIGAYPVRPRGVAVIRLSPTTAQLDRVIDHPYEWDYAGTTGTFIAPGRVLFATLSQSGVQLINVGLR